jgi:hypothetical protein
MITDSRVRQVAKAAKIEDIYSDDRKAGNVIGSRTPNDVIRRGIDREKCISIDNGALRIQPLIQPGWGRAGISYEPYQRQNGLALAVFMLNGHNTSQTGVLGESFRSRMTRWLLGSEAWSRGRRFVQWIRSGRIGRAIREFRWWFYLSRNRDSLISLDENLAVGWFATEAPENPLMEGNAFVMHATGAENGELWAAVGASPLPAVRSVQNLQIYYVVVLRDEGAAYYASSVEGANGFPAFPEMRPLAIDPFNTTQAVYPGIHQSVLGQIGFRLDTRVYGLRVEQIEELSEWYGTAHAADRLNGSGLLRRSEAETGGCWTVPAGEVERRDDGAYPVSVDSMAIIDPGAPSGLIHAICGGIGEQNARAGLIWRFRDRANHWRLLIDDAGCSLSVKEDGAWTELAASDRWKLERGVDQSVQLLDDGEAMSFHLRGELMFGMRFRDERLRDATGTGFSGNPGTRLQSFEAHPRTLPVPHSLRMGEPWLRRGTEVVIEDHFQGAVADLSGRPTPTGGKIWRKQIGTGVMELTGGGAVKIKATAKEPSRGRTAYMVDWDNPDFADLAVEITPPGTKPEDREHGLCGFIFWQDPDNYITVNIWVNRSYGGASISCFFQLDGFEDLYDAIWTNVGRRVYYGVPVALRMAFDGMRYTVFVNEEPVLYRTLKDVYPNYGKFSINRVGLMANWEWGNDTGSMFKNFVGRV